MRLPRSSADDKSVTTHAVTAQLGHSRLGKREDKCNIKSEKEAKEKESLRKKKELARQMLARPHVDDVARFPPGSAGPTSVKEGSWIIELISIF